MIVLKKTLINTCANYSCRIDRLRLFNLIICRASIRVDSLKFVTNYQDLIF